MCLDALNSTHCVLTAASEEKQLRRHQPRKKKILVTKLRNCPTDLHSEHNSHHSRIQRSQTRVLTRVTSQNGLTRHGGPASNSAANTETKLTWISLSIICLYLMCHIWKLIPTVYEAIHGFDETIRWPRWLRIIQNLSHVLVVINSAINFVPYWVSQKF
jgi:hypothetical protein